MTEILRYAAFTRDPSGGNPAGVVLGAEGMSDAQMQHIAAEVGYSETAFVTIAAGGDSAYGLRFFSPLAEVAFCGHATIATSVAIADRQGPSSLVFDTPAGEIQVRTQRVQVQRDDAVIEASMRSVPTWSRPADGNKVAMALEALRWSADDLAPGFPPHVAFAGNQHLMLAAATRERLADLDYNFDQLLNLMSTQGWTTVQLFWEEDEHMIHARNPFPIGGVVEDPATGAAAAALGGYLRELGHVTTARHLTILQGVDMGRPSELGVEIRPNDPRITITGRAIPIPVA